MAQFGTGPRGESVGFKIGGLIEIEREYHQPGNHLPAITKA